MDKETDDAALEEKLKQLTPEQAEMFVRALSLAMRKRKIMLLGYVGVLFVLLLGMLAALYVYGRMERGTFVGWVFLVPAATASVLLIMVGKLAKRIGK